jgi:hypothetical protein
MILIVATWLYAIALMTTGPDGTARTSIYIYMYIYIYIYYVLYAYKCIHVHQTRIYARTHYICMYYAFHECIHVHQTRARVHTHTHYIYICQYNMASSYLQ